MKPRSASVYVWRGTADEGIYNSFKDIKALQRRYNVFGDFKRFSALSLADAKHEANAYLGREVARPAPAAIKDRPTLPARRRFCDFWTKLIVVMLVVPTTLFIIHHGATHIYSVYCTGWNVFGNPMCRTVHEIQRATLEHYDLAASSISVAISSALLQGVRIGMNWIAS